MTFPSAALDFFYQLLRTPSPPGAEERVQRLVRDWVQQFADEVHTDVHGNVIAVRNPQGYPRIILDAHCDQIALMVQFIDDQGFLHCVPMGGWDAQVLLGQQVSVWTSSGEVPGVISRRAKHLLPNEEQKKVPEIHELWVDIGVANGTQAKEIVQIGDPVTPKLGQRQIRDNLLTGPKMDDTSGLFVILEALRRLPAGEFAPAVYAVSAVQEEIGLRGAQTAAFGIDPQLGIAVDVTHATDIPDVDTREHGLIKLGHGPVVFRGPNINPVLFGRLQAVSQEAHLPIQLKGANRAVSNDGDVLQRTRAGVATAVIGLPNRYMHTPVEMISLDDLNTAADLIARFVQSVQPDDSFIPTDANLNVLSTPVMPAT